MMSRFFTNSPNADTYNNAVDKSAWLEETIKSVPPMDYTMYDIERSDRLIQQQGPGCYVPISSGGTHV
eukprot:SAG25_NODE_8985_length_393_cov_1.037415_1_plen_67_part_10